MKRYYKYAFKVIVIFVGISFLGGCTYTGFHPGCDIRVNTCGKSIPVNEYSR